MQTDELKANLNNFHKTAWNSKWNTLREVLGILANEFIVIETLSALDDFKSDRIIEIINEYMTVAT